MATSAVRSLAPRADATRSVHGSGTLGAPWDLLGPADEFGGLSGSVNPRNLWKPGSSEPKSFDKRTNQKVRTPTAALQGLPTKTNSREQNLHIFVMFRYGVLLAALAHDSRFVGALRWVCTGFALSRLAVLPLLS